MSRAAIVPMPHPNDWGPRTFDIIGYGAYQLTVKKANVSFTITRLRREREELIGELVVRIDMAGARTVDGILSSGDFNLSSVQARSTRAKHLAARALADDMDWEGWLSELCLRVIDAERVGYPATLVSLIDPPSDEPDFTVLGWPLPLKQPTILFGDGGAAKSLLSLYVAGELASGGHRVLYADWESDGGDHRRRLDQLYPRGLPPVLYVRCERPLTVEVDRLRTIVTEHDVTYVVLDSAAFGCHGAPESAEAAIGYFRALRTLNCGALVIAHVTKAEDGDKRPFGSAFWQNSARSTFHIKRSNPDSEGDTVDVLLSQRKCNGARLLAPFALSLTFGQSITIHRSQAADTPEFAMSLTLTQRLTHAVKHRPYTLADLYTEFPSDKPDAIRRAVNRSVERGQLVRFAKNNETLIGLVHHGD